MNIELYEIKYMDRDAAKLIYRELSRDPIKLGIASCGLTSYRTKSKHARNRLKIILAITNDKAQDIPYILKTAQQLLSNHPLYSYLSFDSISVPLTQNKIWRHASTKK